MNTATLPLSAAPAKPWYRHVWPWLLMLGPFLVIVGGIHASYLAFSRPDALVVDDYYKEGKAINQDLRRDRAASSMKLAGSLRYDAAQGKLAGTLTAAGKPYASEVTLRLIHSTQPEKDLKLLVKTDPNGAFSVALPMLEMARWRVMVEGPQREWRLAAVWSWPQARHVDLRAD